MDSFQFDTLVKQLAARRLTRGQTRRALAVGAIAVLTGLRLVVEEGQAKGKGKKKRRRKKKLVCICSASGCTSQNVKKPSQVINQNPRCNYAGGCTSNPCVPTCSPANNTQGTCSPGQLCSPEANCVAGCTATTHLAQGSCPAGQVCSLFFHFEIPFPPTIGRCQTGPVCTPTCPATQVCCAAGTAAAGKCRSDLQAC